MIVSVEAGFIFILDLMTMFTASFQLGWPIVTCEIQFLPHFFLQFMSVFSPL